MTELNKSQKLRACRTHGQPGGIPAEEAVEAFDLDDRTLRRYLADLRGIQVPVIDEGRGLANPRCAQASVGKACSCPCSSW